MASTETREQIAMGNMARAVLSARRWQAEQEREQAQRARLRAVAEAVVSDARILRSQDTDWLACGWCYVSAKRPEDIVHTPDCLWNAAREALRGESG
jgi:1,6-anhydro-N-acetylmuramate kinase